MTKVQTLDHIGHILLHQKSRLSVRLLHVVCIGVPGPKGPGPFGQAHARGHHQVRPAPRHQRGRAHGVLQHHQVRPSCSLLLSDVQKRVH